MDDSMNSSSPSKKKHKANISFETSTPIVAEPEKSSSKKKKKKDKDNENLDVQDNAEDDTNGEGNQDIDLIHKLYECPICLGHLLSTQKVSDHMAHFHRISLENQRRINLKIAEINLD